MYASYFGLKQSPFSIAPDPRYLFMSERHREALAHLLYGVNGGGGFVLLTGEIGAGKTTICRCLLEQIPRRCNVAYIFNPKMTVPELLQSVCDEFHIPLKHEGHSPATVKDYIDPLNEYLLKTHAVGQNNVLIIDEAQNLSAEVLEQLRLMTNLETNERKLLQIILIGQPELRDMLARPDMEQLAQRVIARCHLDAMSEKETAQYILHRLTVAGLKKGALFEPKAIRRIHQITRGVPRRINLLCDRSLLGAYAEGRTKVDRPIVDKAATEVFPPPTKPSHGSVIPLQAVSVGLPPYRPWLAMGSAVLAGVVMVGAAAALYQRQAERLSKQTQPKATDSRTTTVATATSAPAIAASAATIPPSAPSAAAAATNIPANAALPLGTAEEVLAAAWHNEDTAVTALAKQWQVQLGKGDACQVATRQQLFCFRNSSGLPLVRQLERPVMLMLHGDRTPTLYGVLVALDDQFAVLQLGEQRLRIALGTLANVWRGDFVTLWKAPESYRSKILLGQSGPVVDWVAQRMSQIDGKGTPSQSERIVYDTALQGRVQDFQLAQGLKPDGVVGGTTFMQINRLTGIDEPRLPTPATLR
ncbi:MAG: AAA family ATPase [Aquabacterium sp.]|uniref:ExeA family protein n=1 Tax=Aquabacterium sp. TaxID=1872578 RepID=UPI003BB9DB5F